MDKIYTLSIKCVAGMYLSQAYSFVLALPADCNFDDLAYYILDVIEFDGEHLSGFYAARTPHSKRTWLKIDAPWEDDGEMPDALLSEIFPLERNKKLFFEYDPGASWCFEIVRKGRETSAVAGQTYPILVMEEGVKPLEYGDDGDDGVE